MDIKELRMDMMRSKKDNPERSRVLQAVLNLAQLTAKEDGNREPEAKDIISAVKKEMKMAQQSKDAGAPYNPMTFEVCESFLPKTLSADETRTLATVIINALPEKNMKAMGKVIGALKASHGEAIDSALASGIVKELLNS